MLPVPLRRRFLVVVCGALLVLGAAGVWLLASAGGAGRTGRALDGLSRPIVFAHRGGAGEAPESTVAALQLAARDPGTAVELDVRRSRDGHLVAMHDATVDRTTNGKGRVADLTLAQLRALDAGYCASPGQGRGTLREQACEQADPARVPFRGRGHRIPTIAEALAALPRTTLVLLELKEPGAEAALAAVVRASGRLPRVVVGSENDAVAARLKQLLPEVTHFFPKRAAACLAVAAKLRVATGCDGYDLLAVPRTAAGLDLTSPTLIAGAHARGVSVVYFTINDEEEMERLLRAGADGIITDYPTRARRVLQRLRRD